MQRIHIWWCHPLYLWSEETKLNGGREKKIIFLKENYTASNHFTLINDLMIMNSWDFLLCPLADSSKSHHCLILPTHFSYFFSNKWLLVGVFMARPSQPKAYLGPAQLACVTLIFLCLLSFAVFMGRARYTQAQPNFKQATRDRGGLRHSKP